MDYFEQIKLLGVVKQKSKTIVVDDNSNKQKKASSQCTKSAKAKENAKGKLPGKDKRKTCDICHQFGGNPNHCTAKDCYRHKFITNNKSHMLMNVEDLYASNLKLTKKLKSTRGRANIGSVTFQSLCTLALSPVDFSKVMRTIY
eukprot:15358589-Ditylum_brightwellii.AAC.1